MCYAESAVAVRIDGGSSALLMVAVRDSVVSEVYILGTPDKLEPL